MRRWIFTPVMLLLPLLGISQRICGTSGMPAKLDAPTLLTQRTDVVFQVVVHLVYASDKENLSDAVIRSQIDILNRDFSGATSGLHRVKNIGFRELIATPGWRFCLASTDPDGRPTNGIVRVQTNVPGIAHPGSLDRGLRKIKHTALGGSDAWDTDKYINIWVGSTGDDVVIGDATFPGTAKDGEDGIMVDYRVFGGFGETLGYIPFHLGKTLTHEMGHFFNLAHLSGNGDCNADDGVADTPPQGREYFDCPGGPVSSCGSEDMVQNFLSLASDPCLLFFTRGQVARMDSALLQYRSSLIGHLTECELEGPSPGNLGEQVTVINPIRAGQILMSFSGYPDQPIHCDLFDLTGREIRSQQVSGESFFAWDVDDLPAGIYLLRFTRGEERHTVKVML